MTVDRPNERNGVSRHDAGARLLEQIAALERAAREAAERAFEAEHRRRGLARPGSRRWRLRDERWRHRYLVDAERHELSKRQPQIEWLRRKLARL